MKIVNISILCVYYFSFLSFIFLKKKNLSFISVDAQECLYRLPNSATSWVPVFKQDLRGVLDLSCWIGATLDHVSPIVFFSANYSSC